VRKSPLGCYEGKETQLDRKSRDDFHPSRKGEEDVGCFYLSARGGESTVSAPQSEENERVPIELSDVEGE